MFSATFSKSILCAVVLATIASAAPAGSSAPLVPSSVLSAPATIIASSATPVAASSGIASAQPSEAASGTASAVAASQTVPFASTNPNEIAWSPEWDGNPQPVRGSLGASILGPQDTYMDQQNPDLLAPPTTDSGSVGNAKWPFSLSHNRLQTGGWARQQNVGVMPIATEMAGVNMRLEVGAVRELHWHKTSEWAYVLKGSVQVTAVDPSGRNFIGTVNQGDLWFFPAGIPHSLQATPEDPDGAEFLLVFDTGDFSEDSTFLLTDWLNHVPKSVLAKNFGADISAFDKLPGKELYIFPAAPPAADSAGPVSPQGTVPSPYTFAMSQMKTTQLPGGSVKIVDSHVFPISLTTAAAEVVVEPGAMRELHWHPTQDEWSFFLEGQARVTLFASQGSARTFNYVAGDVGYVPGTFGHYVENIGNTTLRFLEIFKTDTFQDISLNQWLALTPPDMVKATLNLDDEAMSHLNKVKQTVVGGGNSTAAH